MLKMMPIAQARRQLTLLPTRLSRAHEVVTVTRRGRPVLAILPWEEYEALVETLEILSDEDAMTSLRQSLKEVKQGKLIPWELAKRKLGL